jgi:hypothetical protein
MTGCVSRFHTVFEILMKLTDNSICGALDAVPVYWKLADTRLPVDCRRRGILAYRVGLR